MTEKVLRITVQNGSTVVYIRTLFFISMLTTQFVHTTDESNNQYFISIHLREKEDLKKMKHFFKCLQKIDFRII